MAAKKTFGRTIRDLRKLRFLTRRDLAERVATRLFDFKDLGEIENDRMPSLSVAVIVALAAGLDVDPDELFAVTKRIPTDLGDVAMESEGAKTFFRTAVDEDISEEEWNKLIKSLKRMKKARGSVIPSGRNDSGATR